MIVQVIKSAFLALGVGFVCQLAQDWLATQYFTEFLYENLINLLVALLAVNSATMGIVLTKIRELIEKYGQGDAFQRTRAQFLLSIKEQVALIATSIVFLTVSDSKYLSDVPRLDLFVGTVLTAIFVYAMMILYDTAKAVLIVVDHDA